MKIFLLLSFCFAHCAGVDVCPSCKDSIPGCQGGAACPLLVDVAANIAAFSAENLDTPPVMTNLLPPRLLSIFTRSVNEFILGIAATPAGGRAVDFSEAKYNNPGAVVKAAYFGHCSAESAMLELMRRMDVAENVDAMTRLKMAVDVLKTRGEMVVSSTVGLYSFILYKISHVFEDSSVLRLASPSSSASKATRAELTTSLVRPSTSEQFYELLMLFVQTLVAMGLVNLSVIMIFVNNTVFKPLHDLKLSWEQRFELFLLYVTEIESDVTRSLNFANVFDRGKHDSMLQQAKINAAVFFRTRAGTAQPGGAPNVGAVRRIEWNGKATSTAAKCCVPWNLGKPHSAASLLPDGTCSNVHACMQFVSDKGPGGQCRGNHARTDCDYPIDKRSNSPSK